MGVQTVQHRREKVMLQVKTYRVKNLVCVGRLRSSLHDPLSERERKELVRGGTWFVPLSCSGTNSCGDKTLQMRELKTLWILVGLLGWAAGLCGCGPMQTEDCAQSALCRVKGLCVQVNGTCQAGSKSHCQLSQACQDYGLCSEQSGRCTASSDEECHRSQQCKERGLCIARNGRCIAITQKDCQDRPACPKQGLCSLNPRSFVCEAATDRDCKTSELCTKRAQCQAEEGRCMLPLSFCRESEGCKKQGLCSRKGSDCLALTSNDCADSEACRLEGKCEAFQGQCVKDNAAEGPSEEVTAGAPDAGETSTPDAGPDQGSNPQPDNTTQPAPDKPSCYRSAPGAPCADTCDPKKGIVAGSTCPTGSYCQFSALHPPGYCQALPAPSKQNGPKQLGDTCSTTRPSEFCDTQQKLACWQGRCVQLCDPRRGVTDNDVCLRGEHCLDQLTVSHLGGVCQNPTGRKLKKVGESCDGLQEICGVDAVCAGHKGEARTCHKLCSFLNPNTGCSANEKCRFFPEANTFVCIEGTVAKLDVCDGFKSSCGKNLTCYGPITQPGVCRVTCTPGKSSTCPTGQQCKSIAPHEGACVPATQSLGDRCDTHKLCASGLVCAHDDVLDVSKCTRACDPNTKPSCPAGYRCDAVQGRALGTCVKVSRSLQQTCGTGMFDLHCLNSLTCVRGFCRPSCQTNSPSTCGPGEICRLGGCVKATQVAGEICDGQNFCITGLSCISDPTVKASKSYCLKPCQSDRSCVSSETCRAVNNQRFCLPEATQIAGESCNGLSRRCKDGLTCREGQSGHVCEQACDPKRTDQCLPGFSCKVLTQGSTTGVCRKAPKPLQEGQVCGSGEAHCANGLLCHKVQGEQHCIKTCKIGANIGCQANQTCQKDEQGQAFCISTPRQKLGEVCDPILNACQAGLHCLPSSDNNMRCFQGCKAQTCKDGTCQSTVQGTCSKEQQCVALPQGGACLLLGTRKEYQQCGYKNTERYQCAAGLWCLQGRCQRLCHAGQTNSCPTGGTTHYSQCAKVMGSYGYCKGTQCLLGPQDNCPAQHTCVARGDGIRYCTRDFSTQKAGDACLGWFDNNKAKQCKEGLLCLDTFLGREGRCARVCSPSEPWLCPQDSNCVQVCSSIHSGTCQHECVPHSQKGEGCDSQRRCAKGLQCLSDGTSGVCVEPCRADRHLSCPSQETCEAHKGTSYCKVLTGQPLGELCHTTLQPCAQGLSCLHTSGANPRCVKPCAVGKMGACGKGFYCEATQDNQAHYCRKATPGKEGESCNTDRPCEGSLSCITLTKSLGSTQAGSWCFHTCRSSKTDCPGGGSNHDACEPLPNPSGGVCIQKRVVKAGRCNAATTCKDSSLICVQKGLSGTCEVHCDPRHNPCRNGEQCRRDTPTGPYYCHLPREGESCSQSCAPGLFCAGPDAAGRSRCVRICDPKTSNPCPNGGTCSKFGPMLISKAFGGGESQSIDLIYFCSKTATQQEGQFCSLNLLCAKGLTCASSTWTSGMSHCVRECVGSSNACPAGTACYVRTMGSLTVLKWCKNPKAGGKDGAICDNQNPCAPGLVCEGSPSLGKVCTRRCNPQDKNACPSGFQCHKDINGNYNCYSFNREGGDACNFVANCKSGATCSGTSVSNAKCHKECDPKLGRCVGGDMCLTTNGTKLGGTCWPATGTTSTSCNPAKFQFCQPGLTCLQKDPNDSTKWCVKACNPSLNHKDCGAQARCAPVGTSTTVGYCQPTSRNEDDPCDSSSNVCHVGLSCIAGLCRKECDLQAPQCHASQVCTQLSKTSKLAVCWTPTQKQGDVCNAGAYQFCLPGMACVSTGLPGATARCYKTCNPSAPSCQSNERCLTIDGKSFCATATQDAGNVCDSDNFCKGNLVCAGASAQSAYCRQPCDPKAPQCPSAMKCFTTPDQRGFCEISAQKEGDPCNDLEKLCDPGLVCLKIDKDAHRCHRPCTTNNDCKNNETCVISDSRKGCVAPTRKAGESCSATQRCVVGAFCFQLPGAPKGECATLCSPQQSNACSTGEVCTPFTSTVAACLRYQRKLGESCGIYEQCKTGFTCLTEEKGGATCYKECKSNNDCASNQGCAPISSSTSVCFDLTQEKGDSCAIEPGKLCKRGLTCITTNSTRKQNYCFPVCNPKAPSCSKGEVCLPVGSAGICYPSNSRQDQEACYINNNECSSGLGCYTLPDLGHNRCLRPCSPSQPSSCPQGLRCEAFGGGAFCIKPSRNEGESCNAYKLETCQDGYICLKDNLFGDKCRKQCNPNQSNSCPTGFTCTAQSSTIAYCKPNGTKKEGEACKNDCKQGLACLNLSSSLGYRCYQPCNNGGGVCSSGLPCVKLFNSTSSYCALPVRPEGWSCSSTSLYTCQAGISCINGTCQRIRKKDQSKDQPCYAGDRKWLGYTCKKGLVCANNNTCQIDCHSKPYTCPTNMTCNRGFDSSYCVAHTQKFGEYCNDSPIKGILCNNGLHCISGTCIDFCPGQSNSGCPTGAVCDYGFCLPRGLKEGEACGISGSSFISKACNQGLTCQNGKCVQ